jgi:hypothetical protein
MKTRPEIIIPTQKNKKKKVCLDPFLEFLVQLHTIEVFQKLHVQSGREGERSVRIET